MIVLSSPENPAPLGETDIYAAVKDFVVVYALGDAGGYRPAMDAARVFQGWQNRAALPPASNDYAVISVIAARRRGTPVETFRAAAGVLSVAGLIEVDVQVDFCSEDDTARQRAQRLATVARSGIGVRFFNDRGMSCLYAGDVGEQSFVGDAQQFVRRYSATLHLSLWSGVSVELDYFSQVRMSRLENVDVHHPVHKE